MTSPLGPEDHDRELDQRYLSRERRKVVGLIAIAIVILVLIFLFYGKTIPWSAR